MTVHFQYVNLIYRGYASWYILVVPDQREHTIFVFWGLSCFTNHDDFHPDPFCCTDKVSFSFMAVYYSVCVLHFLYSVISWWVSGLVPYLSYYELRCYKHRVQVTFSYTDFIMFGYIARCGIAESYSRSSFRYLGHLHIVFHNDYSSLYSHQQGIGVPFPPHPCYYCFLISVW